MAKKKIEFTPSQAAVIVDALDLEGFFHGDEEEASLLRKQNPSLYAAQKALLEYSRS